MNKDLERRQLLEMVGRIGYARPRHSHIQARAEERAILEEMVAEGVLERAYEKVDRHGEPNSRGQSVRTVWIATEKGKRAAEEAHAAYVARRKASAAELDKDHTTLDS